MAKATLILHSGDYDKVYSALIIGNGALAMGMECTIYFTFWGLQRLKKGQLSKGKLSKMHMMGLGKWFVKRRMNAKNVVSLERLMRDYKELGGKVLACDMTMDIMGVKKDDFEPGIVDECGAVGSYINEAQHSDITLFI